MKQVLQKRKQGDANFGKDVDAERFNKLVESVEERAVGRNLFAEKFGEVLEN